jgi:four helix bundle protein
MTRANRVGMGHHPVATNHTELIAWRLCADLRRLVLQFTRREPVREDQRFCAQIRAAARSACYLTSEGFYRKRDGDFVNFLVWARASLGEAGDQIGDGLESGYFTSAEHDEMITLVKRACGANSGLRRYLNTERDKARRRKSRGPATPGKAPRTRQPPQT